MRAESSTTRFLGVDAEKWKTETSFKTSNILTAGGWFDCLSTSIGISLEALLKNAREKFAGVRGSFEMLSKLLLSSSFGSSLLTNKKIQKLLST